MSPVKRTLKELAQRIDAKILGDETCSIEGIGTLQAALPGQLSFLSNKKYKKYLHTTRASAVILSPEDAQECATNALIVKDPYFAYAKIAALFAKTPSVPKGIHPSVIIGLNCHIADSACIGPYTVIGDNVTIGENTQIDTGCHIGNDCKLGDNCRLWPRVTLYYDVQLGHRNIVHSGVVIGSDGFGIAPHQGQWQKVPQLGGVRIGNDVEIGSNTTIDRGAVDHTVIEDSVKLDNQIQIAHNVHIGAYTAIAGCVGIAGSSTIGKHCLIGGASGISGHITITDGVIVTGMSMVTNSIKEPGIYSSGTGVMKNHDWQKNVVRMRQLDKIARQVNRLEKELQNNSNHGDTNND